VGTGIFPFLAGLKKSSALGVPQTPERTGTGNNLFPEWGVVGTGNGNREHASHSFLCPSRRWGRGGQGELTTFTNKEFWRRSQGNWRPFFFWF